MGWPSGIVVTALFVRASIFVTDPLAPARDPYGLWVSGDRIGQVANRNFLGDRPVAATTRQTKVGGSPAEGPESATQTASPATASAFGALLGSSCTLRTARPLGGARSTSFRAG
jgi:hypothetical protein